MVADFHQNSFRRVHTVLTTLVFPLQYAVSAPVKAIENASQTMTAKHVLQSQNANLQVQVLLLKGQLQKLLAIENENNQLRGLLQAYPKTSDRVAIAELLAVDSDSFVHEVILNTGSNEGVYLGQPVLAEGGVIGQVIGVGPYSSRVMLLTDSRSAVPVEDSRTGAHGIVVGTGNPNYLELTNIPATADINEGDQLITTGLGGNYPAGYPVGVVAWMRHSPSDEFTNIKVRPGSYANRANLVLLVWPSKNAYYNPKPVVKNKTTQTPVKPKPQANGETQ